LLAFTGPQNGNETDANTDNVYFVDPATGNRTNAGTTGLTTWDATIDNNNNLDVEQALTAGTNNNNGEGMLVTAVAERPVGNDTEMFIVARRGNGTETYTSAILDGNGDIVGRTFGTPATNYLYEVNPDNGAVLSARPNNQQRTGDARAQGAGTNQVEIGRILSAAGDDIVGTVFVGSTLYAFSESGAVVSISAGERGNNPTPGQVRTIGSFHDTVPITGTLVSATPAPDSVTGYDGVALLVTTAGTVYAYDPVAQSAALQAINDIQAKVSPNMTNMFGLNATREARAHRAHLQTLIRAFKG